MTNLPKILPPPTLPSNLKDNAKWLSGEGAGSWFVIESLEDSAQYYIVTRYSPTGRMECTGTFSSSSQINLSNNYEVSYPSHCQKVSIVQNEEIIHLQNIDT